MSLNSRDIRTAIEAKWHESLSKYGHLFSSDSLSGTSPPSVFVGSYGYPKVSVGPMVPPIHGDTSLLDSPEKWKGKSLEEIVNFRLNLIRGVKKISNEQTDGRYIESLQEVTMSSKPTDSDLLFQKPTSPKVSLDGESAPFGPVGEIKSAKFSGTSSVKSIEKIFYDKDLKAQDAVMTLYNSGIEISKIQKCFSIGMMGQKRKLVPTKWSITATDDIISKSLTGEVLDYSLIDSYKVFSYEHLGNSFSVVLFPHRWIYEMIEAWYSNGILGFGSDYEDARGIHHPPAIAGAYFAAKLGVLEYLSENKIQAGVIILREIRPEYAVPVGVWQVREGIREAMKQKPILPDNFDNALHLASQKMSISKSEWLSHGNISALMRQKTLSDFF
jgi:DNA repair protein NreA